MNSYSRRFSVSENMHLHSLVYDVIDGIVVVILLEPEKVSVVFTNDETVEHLLNIGHNCFGKTLKLFRLGQVISKSLSETPSY